MAEKYIKISRKQASLTKVLYDALVRGDVKLPAGYIFSDRDKLEVVGFRDDLMKAFSFHSGTRGKSDTRTTVPLTTETPKDSN